MATHLKPFDHRRTDSEAMADLNEVFKSVDIDGEGKLDQASFLTALMSLEIQLPESDLAKIFEELDTDDSGYIEYDQITKFLKMGKIPSSLLNKAKKTPRKSVIFGPPTNLSLKKSSSTGGGSVILFPPTAAPTPTVQQLDPSRLKMIQRALIVIKKAMLKNITRAEVCEFLESKGMKKEDIEIAYVRAQDSVMSPEERLKYLGDLAESRLLEISEVKKVNSYLTDEMTSHTREIEVLKDIVSVCTKTLLNTFDKKFDKKAPTAVKNEIANRLKKTQADFQGADEQKDDRATRVHEKDIGTLMLMEKCVDEGKHFHAYLCFHQLDQVIRDAMPATYQFLANYKDPN